MNATTLEIILSFTDSELQILIHKIKIEQHERAIIAIQFKKHNPAVISVMDFNLDDLIGESLNGPSPAPVIETATPVIETATPVIEIATPVIETATPVIEIATPVIEIANADTVFPYQLDHTGRPDDSNTCAANCLSQESAYLICKTGYVITNSATM